MLPPRMLPLGKQGSGKGRISRAMTRRRSQTTPLASMPAEGELAHDDYPVLRGILAEQSRQELDSSHAKEGSLRPADTEGLPSAVPAASAGTGGGSFFLCRAGASARPSCHRAE